VVDQLEQRDAKFVIIRQMMRDGMFLADPRGVCDDGRLRGNGNGR
jgi:hypothetical protein